MLNGSDLFISPRLYVCRVKGRNVVRETGLGRRRPTESKTAPGTCFRLAPFRLTQICPTKSSAFPQAAADQGLTFRPPSTSLALTRPPCPLFISSANAPLLFPLPHFAAPLRLTYAGGPPLPAHAVGTRTLSQPLLNLPTQRASLHQQQSLRSRRSSRPRRQKLSTSLYVMPRHCMLRDH